MSLIRVKAENAEKYVKMLIDAGYTASIENEVHHTLHNGCSDEECCEQHESFYKPELWKGIRTNCSGTKFHALVLPTLK